MTTCTALLEARWVEIRDWILSFLNQIAVNILAEPDATNEITESH